MTQNHDDSIEDQQFDSEEEETEYYDMSAFERRLMRRVNYMDNKLDRILDLSGDHNSRVRSIQFQYTQRAFFRLIKWGIIIGGIAYIYFNFIQPITNPSSTGGQILQNVSGTNNQESDPIFDFSQFGDYISSLGDRSTSTENSSGE